MITVLQQCLTAVRLKPSVTQTCKVDTVHALKAYGVVVHLQSFWTSVQGAASRNGLFTCRGNHPRYSQKWRLGGPQIRSACFRHTMNLETSSRHRRRHGCDVRCSRQNSWEWRGSWENWRRHETKFHLVCAEVFWTSAKAVQCETEYSAQ